MQLLASFMAKLTDEEYEWAKQAVTNEVKNVMTIIMVYNMTRDADDFIHSIKKVSKIASRK